MRSTLKTSTLERKFPLMSVENGCILSKDADITVAFRLSLPELFTVSEKEYEQVHTTWCKAIKEMAQKQSRQKAMCSHRFLIIIYRKIKR